MKCYRPQARSADLKSPCLSPFLLSCRTSRRFLLFTHWRTSPLHTPVASCLKKKPKTQKSKKQKTLTPQETSRFYLSLIYAAFSNCTIPAGVTALWRSLGAILPAWVCQKPICMRRANVLEIKAPTCQVNSLHLYEAVKLFHLPLSREIKDPPGEGCPRTKAKDGAPCLGVLKAEDNERREERGMETRTRTGALRPAPGSATWRSFCLTQARQEHILSHYEPLGKTFIHFFFGDVSGAFMCF